MNITIVDTLEGFQELAADWSQLENHFCLSHAWLYTWWETIGSQKNANQLCVIKLVQDGQLVGVAPLYIEKTAMFGRTLKFLGNGTTCSDMMTFPTRAGLETSMAEVVLETIQNSDFVNRFGRVAMIELEGHFANDPVLETFAKRSSQAGFEMDSRELEGCWRIAIPKDWDEFRQLIKKRQRRKINKVDSLLATGEFDVNYLETPEDIMASWSCFVDLHQKRRNQLGQEGCFMNSEFNQFLSLAAERLAQDNRVLLTMVKHQGRPLSAVLCFYSGDCVCVYQSGLDTDATKLEPGHFANTMTFRAAQERGFACLDFLRGDESYKADWGCSRSTLFRTRLVAPNASAQLRHRIMVGSRQVRVWANELLSRSFSGDARSSSGA